MKRSMYEKQNTKQNNSRGRFRAMEMRDLRTSAELPLWNTSEWSFFQYRHPIPPKRRWLSRSWKTIAERHIVHPQKAPYTLVEGIPSKELYERDGFWCAKSPQTHVGPFLNAIDFLVPDGTPVLAARDGVIIEAVDSHVLWGDNEGLRDHLNFITIAHPIGERKPSLPGKNSSNDFDVEWTQYCHLATGSINELGLSVGMPVKQGQRIGTVGKTGITDRDHLHFIVFQKDLHPENPFGFKSFAPRFCR